MKALAYAIYLEANFSAYTTGRGGLNITRSWVAFNPAITANFNRAAKSA